METQNPFSDQFQAIYEGDPWYGKSICKVLEHIDAETAFRHLPERNVHTIAELLAHMISWKQTLLNSLEKNGKPKPRQKDTFLTLAYGASPEIAWPRLKQALDEQHRTLLRLLQPAEGSKQGRLPQRLITGVMQHDIYHLGQIALLKKALTKQ